MDFMLNTPFTRMRRGFAMSFPLKFNGAVAMTPLALHEFHRAAGAAFTEVNGCEVVSDYGDWRAEYAALREGAAVLDLSFRGRLCLLGTDRQRFLNGQVTNNVKDLPVGRGCYAALVSAKGKLQSDLNIYCLENEMLLDLEPGYAAAVSQRLEKYIIAEDVQIIDASPHYGLLSVQGPKAAEIVQNGPETALALTMIKDPSRGEIYLTNHPRLRAPGFDHPTPLRAGFDLFVPIAPAISPMNDFFGQFLSRGARLCGWKAFETARIEAGIPRFGSDMDETNLAPEALDERSISYSKGCYIGQEVIARIRTYGQVAKALRVLKLDGAVADLPLKGARIFMGQNEAGYVTSAIQSPLWDAVIALGYVRRGANDIGAKLLVQTPGGNISAQIIDPWR
jgi:folate-binding protein YgfZ